MSAKYAAQQATALRLIASKGTAATISRLGTPSTFDPVAQVSTGDITPKADTFHVVGLPPGRSAEFRIGSLAGRNIEQFYIATKDAAFVPSKGDTIAWRGRDWRLVWSETYDPAADGSILVIAYGEA